MMKILFTIDSMQGGGAARVTSILANEFIKEGYEVGIATNLSTRSCVYPLDVNVKTFNIYGKDLRFPITKLLDHIFKLRSVIKLFKPDILIGEQENGIVYSRIASIFYRIPIIGHRHNTFKILGLSRLQRIIYNSVNVSVLLHNTDVDFVGKQLKNAKAIYNPCSFKITNTSQFNKKKIIIVVGSTKRYLDKGFDLVIDMWSKIAALYPEWKLNIIGGGSRKNEDFLKQLVASYNLTDKVVFTGFVKDVDKRLQEASIFLLPSRVEGFPMVINEAISQGCACASFSLKGVMNELYSSDAVLVSEDGDIDFFISNIKRMIESVELRESLVNAAQKELQNYQSTNIIKEWIALIDSIK